MSDWHDEFTEPMHDTPADKNPLIAAMEAAGYTYDGLESTNDNLRFFGEGGQVITMGGYLRKMALDGYCVNLELDDVKEMVSLLRYCSNNLNQYAKRANETGSIYAEDIRDLQNRQNEIWDIAKEILARLATIQ